MEHGPTIPMKMQVQPGEAPDTSQKVDRRDIYRILQALIAAQLHPDLGPNELLATEVLKKSATGQALDEKAAYELRVCEFDLKEDGIVGKMPLRHLAGVARANFEETLEVLRREQPHADWRLVGAEIEQHDLGRTIRLEAPNRSVGAPNIDAILSGGDWRLEAYEGSPMKLQKVPSYRAVVRLVFADVSQAELQNPNDQHGGRNPFEDYIATRFLRQLPIGLRRQRKQAEQILRDMQKLTEKARVEENVPEPPVTDEQVEAARNLIASGMTLAAVAQLLRVDRLQLEQQLTEGSVEEAPGGRTTKARR